ncbi:ATP-binding protein [Paenibacillus macerans]|uniref:ATP-binding protein n=1 Tax=Paenibacillus macerans TaxID=44252 RepID=UPI003D312AC8
MCHSGYRPPKLFNRRKRAHHGAGLWLSICAEIVRLHAGEIGIESRLNEGTKVRVALPMIYN